MRDSTPGAPHIGVDVLDRHELDRLLTRPWFLRFGYAAEEREEARQMGPERRTEFLAGRFAAKEAVLKSLGHGMLQGIPLSDILIARSENGGARVVFLGEASRMGLPPVNLSISHKNNIVVAVALCADRPRNEAPRGTDGSTSGQENRGGNV